MVFAYISVEGWIVDPNVQCFPGGLPIGEYIAAVEQAYQQLKQGEAEELCGEMKDILRTHTTPDPTSPRKN